MSKKLHAAIKKGIKAESALALEEIDVLEVLIADAEQLRRMLDEHLNLTDLLEKDLKEHKVRLASLYSKRERIRKLVRNSKLASRDLMRLLDEES